MTHDRQKNGHGTDETNKAALVVFTPRHGGQSRAYRRLLKAQEAYGEAHEKVARLRVRLDRAEERLVRRAGKLDQAQAALVQATGVEAVPMAGMEGHASDGAVQERVEDGMVARGASDGAETEQQPE